MSRAVRGVRVDDPHMARSLEPVLERTLDLFTLFRRRQLDDEDTAHWYNERATLSVLAAAAWKEGGIALEEYSLTKRGGRAGRADLWVKMPTEVFSFEAKQTWPTAIEGRAKKLAAYWLGEATRDASRIPKTEAAVRAGVVFVVPDLPRSRQTSFDPDAFVREVAGVRHDFVAWWFAPKPWPENYRRRVYPGVVIIGRRVVPRATEKAA